MVYALPWLAVVLLLGLWSLTAWMLHAVAVWTVSQAGALTGVAAGAATVSLPAWLAPWVPVALTQALADAMVALAPVVDGLLQAAPALTGALTVLAWGVWGLGSVLLLLLGGALHLVIAMARRHRGGRPATGASLASG